MKINELKAEVVRKELNMTALANKIKMDRSTLFRRLENPDDFTLNEIRAISRVLGLSDSRIVDIFF